jgi:hypothetical protein
MSEWGQARGIGPIERGPFPWPRKSGPYEVTLRFEWIDGRWECVSIHLDAIDAAGRKPSTITSSLLRQLPLRRFISQVVTFKQAWTLEDVDGTTYTVERDYTALGPKGGRPPKYGPEHFVEVARVYREAYGERRRPTRAVAKHFKTTPAAAAKWVARCRSLRLLPKTSRGKASVEPRRKGRKT